MLGSVGLEQGVCLERGVYIQPPWRGRIVCEPLGSLHSAVMNPSPAWKSLGSAETPGPLPGWTMTSSSAKPQGLGWPSKPASPAGFRPHQCPWRWEDDLKPIPEQTAQPLVSQPQCGFCIN